MIRGCPAFYDTGMPGTPARIPVAERSRARDMELGKAVERGAVRLAAPATVLMESPGASSFRVLCERMGTINLPKPVIPSADKIIREKRTIYALIKIPRSFARWAGEDTCPYATSLATPACTPATPAAIAASVPRHDGSAEAAGGGVAQVDESGESVCGVHRTRCWRTRLRPLVRGR
jgi:hypothetical protein